MADLVPQKHYNHLDVSELTKIRHSPSYLVEKAKVETTRREKNLSQNQQSSLAEYKRQQIYKRLSSDKLRDEDVIRVYFDFFDELFYCSSLKKCKVKLSSPITGKLADLKWRAFIWPSPPKALLVSFVIRIFRRDEITDNMTRRIFYLGWLLHEMTHAFLRLYSCWYPPCRTCLQHIGLTGHGFAWQDIAYAVEKAANDPKFLNLPVELGCYDSLHFELDEIEEHVPHLDLSRWGLVKREPNCDFFGCDAQSCPVQPLTHQTSEIGGFSSYDKCQPN